MNIINKLIIRCFCKLETVDNVLGKDFLHIGDCLRYINGNADIKFIITHIDKEKKEITAKANFRQGYFRPNFVRVYNIDNVHTYVNNPHLFKSVFVEEEHCSLTIRYDIGNERYPYTNFKAIVILSPNANIFIYRFSKIRNTLFLFSEKNKQELYT